jgi:hypothetical protein
VVDLRQPPLGDHHAADAVAVVQRHADGERVADDVDDGLAVVHGADGDVDRPARVEKRSVSAMKPGGVPPSAGISASSRPARGVRLVAQVEGPVAHRDARSFGLAASARWISGAAFRTVLRRFSALWSRRSCCSG